MKKTLCAFAALCLLIFLTPSRATFAAEGTGLDKCQAPTATTEERIAACTAVIAADTLHGRDLAVAYCDRGAALTELQKLDEALDDLDRAIAADRSYACPYSNRGRVKRFQGDIRGAIADYDLAIKRDPTFSIAYNN